MKLATLRTDAPEGRLVVVSRDLTRCTDARRIAPTLQAALDDWARCGPELAAMARDLEIGAEPVERFHERDAAPPLPRPALRFELARGALRPGGQGAMTPPRAHPPLGAGGSLTLQVALGAIFAAVPHGADARAASDAFALATLVASARGAEGELFLIGAPVAATPDIFGADWASGVPTAARLVVDGAPRAFAASPDPSAHLRAVAACAARRPFDAGALVAATLDADAGVLRPGGTLRVEMLDAAGHSLFGAIELRPEAAG
ncbi:MAG: hypothetical protein ACFCUS_05770 [Rubrimonas sp.]|uniref:hypothetical protein n=1 Tax=Rubrimonas sp. TaxID=2036015 RepID=UPI002FDCC433